MALFERLKRYNGNSKKAFTGNNTLQKNPIYLDDMHTMTVPEKVTTVTFEEVYTIRKEISPDLKIDKVIDVHVLEILKARLAE